MTSLEEQLPCQVMTERQEKAGGHRSLPRRQGSNGASARLAGTRVWEVQSEGSIAGTSVRAATVSPMPFTLRIYHTALSI